MYKICAWETLGVNIAIKLQLVTLASRPSRARFISTVNRTRMENVGKHIKSVTFLKSESLY